MIFISFYATVLQSLTWFLQMLLSFNDLFSRLPSINMLKLFQISTHKPILCPVDNPTKNLRFSCFSAL